MIMNKGIGTLSGFIREFRARIYGLICQRNGTISGSDNTMIEFYKLGVIFFGIVLRQGGLSGGPAETMTQGGVVPEKVDFVG